MLRFKLLLQCLHRPEKPLKYGLFNATGITPSMVVTRNIRGEALALLKKDPDQAMNKFKGLLERSVKAARHLEPFSSPARNYNFAAAVIGNSEAAVHSASTLAKAGMDVFMFVKDDKPPEITEKFSNIHCFENALVNQISGTLGDFMIDIQSDNFSQSIHAGAVILGEKSRKKSGLCASKRDETSSYSFFHAGKRHGWNSIFPSGHDKYCGIIFVFSSRNSYFRKTKRRSCRCSGCCRNASGT
jgi:hypothetical protein